MANVTKPYVVYSLHEFVTSVIPSGDGAQSAREALDSIIASFSCEKNPDVESFLKKQAFDHYLRRSAMTYLVFSLESGELVGYFALALRPFTLPLSEITNSQRNRLRCCGLTRMPRAHSSTGEKETESLTDASDSYDAAAVLIGQLGRNFAADMTAEITGSELLDLAIERIHDIQDLAGGGLVIVEAEDHQQLIDFYEKNSFRRFGVRQSASTSADAATTLIQMFKLIGVRKSTSTT